MPYSNQFEFHVNRVPDLTNKIWHPTKVEFQRGENDFYISISHATFGTYSKYWFIIYLKFKLTWKFCILSNKPTYKVVEIYSNIYYITLFSKK